MSVRGYRLGIDWSRHGTYANALEDATSYVMPGDIEVTWGRDASGEVTLASTTGQMAFDLNNESQVFSPENVSSPIVGKILPNREVRFDVTNPTTGTSFNLLTGELDDFDVTDDMDSVFSGVALDAWGRPGAEKLSTPLYSGLRTGDAVSLVLDAIGWAGGRDIDPGVTYMPWWWEEGTDAATAINKLVNSEGSPAIAYVEGGTFVFKDRHHRLKDARSQTSQGTYSAIYPSGTFAGSDFKIEKDTFRYNHGAKGIVNSATFTVDQRMPGSITEVWVSEDPLSVATGETVQIVAQSSDPFFNAITPTISGTGDFQVLTGVISSVSISRTSGQTLILSITCSAAAVVSRMAIRAVPVPVARSVQVSARDAGSIGNFGNEDWPEASAPVWANRYDAQIIATRAVAAYANYRPSITFTVVALNDTYLTEILEARISDRITVRNDKRGINADFVIERLSHRVTRLGVWHRLTVTCQAVEPTQPSNIFTFDVAGKGFNQGLFGIEGIDDPSTMFTFDVAGKGFNQGLFAN